MSIPLLKTKLNIPPQRPNVVLRPRLIDRLEEGQYIHNRLTLVSAKAGSGKTTLVSAWVHQQPRPAAWLSLDPGDNDPYRFFSYLIAALYEVGVKMGQAILSQLETPPFPPPETFFAGLFEPISTPLIIVLDDYHLIQNGWIHQAVGFLIEHQPPVLHQICTTRIDPPLPLARLRARGQIVELRDGDLQFTSEETTLFFKEAMALNLPPEAVSALEERTEGWIAGLQLAAILARGRQQEGDLPAFINAFSGTNRFILDYLMEEVLEQQPAIFQDFLMDTAILERMCGELCDAVRSSDEKKDDQNNSQTILEQLERANLFVIPLDDQRHWYRYHHLFSDLLASTLKQRKSEERIRELHHRASRWHQRAGNLEEAMRHAMDARDYEGAASMIDENIASMFARSEVPVLLGWIEKMPDEVVKGRPWIDVHRANTLVISGSPDEASSLLDEVEGRIKPDTPRSQELLGHIAAVRAYAANLCGDADRAIKMAERAKELLPEDHATGLGTAAYTLADTYFARDDLEGASHALLNMVKVGEGSNQLMIIVLALCELAAVRRAQGHLCQAKELLDQAYQWLVKQDGLGYRLRCSYEFGMSELLREWNQLDAAYEHAKVGDEYRKKLGGYLMVGDLALMRVLQARGDVQGALEALHVAEQVMEAHQLQLAISIEFRTTRVLQWLAAGDLETASRWAQDCNGGSEREQIVLARLWLAQGQARATQQFLDQQRALAEAGRRTGRLIEILCLQALALSIQDKSSEAIQILSHALSLARPEGYVRTFLDLGQPLYTLLKQMMAQDTVAEKSTTITSLTADYARDLLKAFQQEGELQTKQRDQALIAPLTDRELEVLQWLREGLTNKAIAERLVVAPSTVKQHLKNIYSKLDAHNRTQAVARGRELELL